MEIDIEYLRELDDTIRFLKLENAKLKVNIIELESHIEIVTQQVVKEVVRIMEKKDNDLNQNGI